MNESRYPQGTDIAPDGAGLTVWDPYDVIPLKIDASAYWKDEGIIPSFSAPKIGDPAPMKFICARGLSAAGLDSLPDTVVFPSRGSLSSLISAWDREGSAFGGYSSADVRRTLSVVYSFRRALAEKIEKNFTAAADICAAVMLGVFLGAFIDYSGGVCPISRDTARIYAMSPDGSYVFVMMMAVAAVFSLILIFRNGDFSRRLAAHIHSVSFPAIVSAKPYLRDGAYYIDVWGIPAPESTADMPQAERKAYLKEHMRAFTCRFFLCSVTDSDIAQVSEKRGTRGQ